MDKQNPAEQHSAIDNILPTSNEDEMKKLIKTIKDIYSIEDLRTRILITILFVLIYL